MFLCSNLNGFSLKFCSIKERDLADSWLTLVAAHPRSLFTSSFRRQSWLQGIAVAGLFPQDCVS